MVQIFGVITVLSVVWTFLAVNKWLQPQTAGGLMITAFIGLILFPKQSDRLLQWIAAIVAVYILFVTLGGTQAFAQLFVSFAVLLAFYIMLRPFIPKGKK